MSLLPVVQVIDLHWRGFFCAEAERVGMGRIVVFLDWQNVYRGARSAFHNNRGPVQLGNVHPMRLGERLAQARSGRELTEVRVYRGQPDSTKDPKSYGANRRQQAAWERTGAKVIQRSLRYPMNWPDERAEEKGVDAALAVDFVMMAVARTYDVGILMSTDTDLKPALEAVASLKGGPVCEVAAWKEYGRPARQLRVPGVDLWCHYLYLADYKLLADGRDYTISL
jgi:uncharacterized LabA/DUF88 family protein